MRDCVRQPKLVGYDGRVFIVRDNNPAIPIQDLGPFIDDNGEPMSPAVALLWGPDWDVTSEALVKFLDSRKETSLWPPFVNSVCNESEAMYFKTLARFMDDAAARQAGQPPHNAMELLNWYEGGGKTRLQDLARIMMYGKVELQDKQTSIELMKG